MDKNNENTNNDAEKLLDIIDRMKNAFTKQKDRFSITNNKLGCGSFANIYEGLDNNNNNNNNKIAVKKVNLSKAPKKLQSVLVSEPINLAVLKNHKNIVKLYHKKIEKNVLYLYLEYIEGTDLYLVIENYHRVKDKTEKKGLPISIACFFIKQIVEAVRYMHSKNICHRDLKLENTMISLKDTRIVLIDFGFSKEVDDKTLLTDYPGSPSYAAPEMIKSKPYNGKKSDIWSLGVMIYIILSGGMPFYSLERWKLNILIIEADPKYPKYLPDNIVESMKKMMNPIPAFRPDAETILNSEWIKNNECKEEDARRFLARVMSEDEDFDGC